MKCVSVLYFDMKEGGGYSRTYCINRLTQFVEGRDIQRAISLFDRLYSIAGRYAKSGGSIDAQSLLKQIDGLIVVEKTVKKNEEKEEFSKAEKFPNKMVYRPLATLNSNRRWTFY